MFLAFRSNDSFLITSVPLAILALVDRKCNYKSEVFATWHPCFGNLVVQKVVFLAFSKLFWSSLRSVWALFLDLKTQRLVVFSAPKVVK